MNTPDAIQATREAMDHVLEIVRAHGPITTNEIRESHVSARYYRGLQYVVNRLRAEGRIRSVSRHGTLARWVVA